MRHPFYAIYSVLLLGLLGLTAYSRMPFLGASVNEVKNVPKTVRDNPGAYRSHYYGYPRYIGGK